MTLIWRAEGCPAYEQLWPSSPEYKDNIKGSFYYDAVHWYSGQLSTLVDNLTGSERDTFRPNDPCTRMEAVEFLYKVKGSYAAKAFFSDVEKNSWAVNWAVAAGVTTGTSATTFSPDDICTRGQIVTFLHRAYTLEYDTFRDLGGNYSCESLQTKIYVDVSGKRGMNIVYEVWICDKESGGDSMVQYASPTLGLSYTEMRDYSVELYADFLVMTGKEGTWAETFNGIYVKEGHSLPDWAKKKFAYLIY